jgi:hypothetical protein
MSNVSSDILKRLITEMDVLIYSMKVFNMLVDSSYDHLNSEYQSVMNEYVMIPMKASSIVWTVISYDLLCILSAEYHNLKNKSSGQFEFRKGYNDINTGNKSIQVKPFNYIPFITIEYELNNFYGAKLPSQLRRKKKIEIIAREFDAKYDEFESLYEAMLHIYFRNGKSKGDNTNNFIGYQSFFGNNFELIKDTILDKYTLYYQRSQYQSTFKTDVPYRNFKEFLKCYHIVLFTNQKCSNYELNKENDLIKHYKENHFKNMIHRQKITKQDLSINLYDNIKLDYLGSRWNRKYSTFFTEYDLPYLKSMFVKLKV